MIIPIARSQSIDPYQLSFKALNNEQIALSDYHGKKILITIFDASNPDRASLAAFEQLYQQNINSVVVIAVPVSNFQTAVIDTTILKHLMYSTLQLSYPITEISQAQKTDGIAQHSLLAWVTHINQNAHFDEDIDGVGEMFVLSENGKLFARLKEAIPIAGNTMEKILMQKVAD
jgi:glutathione peroxidase